MKHTNSSHFSQALAAVGRTGRLPGGEVRGLPGGRAIGGLQGFHDYARNLAEAQREFEAGRFRLAQDRVKQLEIDFNGIANRWNASVFALITDIRQGKRLKNLEKLKELKAAQARMQQLISPARKALQDLTTALDHDAIDQVREGTIRSDE